MPPDIWFEIEILRREASGEPSQRVEKSWWPCRMLNSWSCYGRSFHRRIVIIWLGVKELKRSNR